jgi:hypothetical protein
MTRDRNANVLYKISNQTYLGRRSSFLISYTACLVLVSLSFFIVGITWKEALCFFLHILIFYGVPGLAIAYVLGWWKVRPDLLTIWSLALGVVFSPALYLPFWIWNLPQAYPIIVIVSLAYLIYHRDNVKPLLEQQTRGWRFTVQGKESIIITLFVICTAFLCVLDPFTAGHSFLESHLQAQGITVQSLQQSFPPKNSSVEGVPLSYNYGVHLIIGYMIDTWSIDPVISVGRIFPLFFLLLLLFTYFAFAVEVMCLPAYIAAIAVVSTFWIIGYGPLNNMLYGALLAPPAIRLIGPLCAFTALLVGLRLIKDMASATTVAKLCLTSFVFAVLVFTATAFRAPIGIVIVCAGLFISGLPVLRCQLPNWRIGILAFLGIFGFILSYLIFFQANTGFSNASFAETSTTFLWLHEKGKFWVVEWLSYMGVSPLLSGMMTFMVMALMQSSFLMPAFMYNVLNFRKNLTDITTLGLYGVSIAGISGTMFLSAPGGSHFSFMHCANLAMSLIGAKGLFQIYHKWKITEGHYRFSHILVVIFCGILFLFSTAEIFYQLNIYSSNARISQLVKRPALKKNEGDFLLIVPLLQHLSPSAKVLYLLPDSKVRRAYQFQHGLNLIAESQVIKLYKQYSSPYADLLNSRSEASKKLRRQVHRGRLPNTLLNEIAKTIVDPSGEFYVLAPADAIVDDNSVLTISDRNEKYTLYSWDIRVM